MTFAASIVMAVITDTNNGQDNRSRLNGSLTRGLKDSGTITSWPSWHPPTSLFFESLFHTPAFWKALLHIPPNAILAQRKTVFPGPVLGEKPHRGPCSASKFFSSPSLVRNPEQVPSLTYASPCSEGRIINSKCVEVFSSTKDGEKQPKSI